MPDGLTNNIQKSSLVSDMNSIRVLLHLLAFGAYYTHDAGGLEIRFLEVPAQTPMFRPVRLGCRFRLGPYRLHSVKWYKDDEEFFRFTPHERPQVREFFAPGAAVELDSSDMHIVKLKNVSKLSAGEYRCEVSSDGPDFLTAHKTAKMDVYASPDRKPEIRLNKNNFTPGEEIIAECTSGKSYPQQTLVWYLNGIKINGSCVIEEKITVTGTGLFRTYSKVKIALAKGPGLILLSCLGEMGPDSFPLRDHAEISLLDGPSHQRFMDTSSGNELIFQQHPTFRSLTFLAFLGVYIYTYMIIYFKCIS